MKILVVIPSLNRGGAERVVSILTQHWCKQHKVVVVLFGRSQLEYSAGGKLVYLHVPSKKNAYR